MPDASSQSLTTAIAERAAPSSLNQAFSAAWNRTTEFARETWDKFTSMLRAAATQKQIPFREAGDRAALEALNARVDDSLRGYGLDSESVARLLTTMRDLRRDSSLEGILVADATGRLDTRIDFKHQAREIQGGCGTLYLGVAKALRLLDSSAPPEQKEGALEALLMAYGHLAGKDVGHAVPQMIADFSRMSASEGLAFASVIGKRILQIANGRASAFQEFLADAGEGVTPEQRIAAMYQGLQIKSASECFANGSVLEGYLQNAFAKFEALHGADAGVAQLWAFVRQETRDVLGSG